VNSFPRNIPEPDQLVADAISRISLQPDQAEGWRLLGQGLLRCNLPDGARAALKQALAVEMQAAVSDHYDPVFRNEIVIHSFKDRLELFEVLCRNRVVLHVGCSDFPLFRPETNLHLKLYNICSRLDGLDTDQTGLQELARHAPGNYYHSAAQVSSAYDLLLVPETIEHVGNIGNFLEELDGIRFSRCLITAPNAFLPNDNGNFWKSDSTYVEFCHPDHTCWFSPATLSSCIRKNTDWQIESVYLLNGGHMVGCLCRKAEL